MNFTKDLKTQKLTKSSMSLLEGKQRDKGMNREQGVGEERCPISILSFSSSHRQDLNQLSKTERENKHKPQNLNPHRDHLEEETHRASPFHLTLLIKYW